jgi:hypothetical protein
LQPRTILVPSRSENVVIDAIKAELPFANQSNVDLRPSAEFNPNTGMARLLSLKLDVPDVGLYLNSLLSLSANQEVRNN